MMVEAPDTLAIDALAVPFAAAAASDPWFHVRMDAFVTNDGRARPADGSLHISPPRTNARTARPQFSLSLAPESRNGGIPAANDHPKWLAYVNHRSSSGLPGFDAMPGTVLAGSARMTGHTYGTELHPFGDAVEDPDADLRLAAFAMTTIDIETWMAFDFLFTNRRIFAFYERLPFGRQGADAYAAFSYAIPVGTRRENDWHNATIVFDAAGIVQWILDDAEVFRVSRIGHRLASREHLLIDLGGEEQDVRPRQLAFGMGLFTLLDGAIGNRPGLVRLSDVTPYFAPRSAAGQALSFVDEDSREESRLFGQGAELSVSSYTIRREEKP